MGVGIGSLPVTPEINGEIGAMCAEPNLAEIDHNEEECQEYEYTKN